ncbi:MAG TPA: hypothetical protein VFA81_04075 [Burkholderiales bacterium]|nr:hypothetical protein [Burkholderiales bacterium]
MSDTFTLGRHEAQIETLVTGMATLQTDVTEIKSILSERKGERHATALFASGSGGIVGAVATLFVKWWLTGHAKP